MSTRKYNILKQDPTASKRRQELVALLNEQVQDNGNTNVLLVHAIAQHVGLSATEFECSSLIEDKGPFTAGELAKRCHISTGGMTGMIDRLERRGLVKRQIDPSDRRRVVVCAVRNEKALQEIRNLYNPLRKSFNELIDSYNDDELAFIVEFMGRVNAMFHNAVDSLPEK